MYWHCTIMSVAVSATVYRSAQHHVVHGLGTTHSDHPPINDIGLGYSNSYASRATKDTRQCEADVHGVDLNQYNMHFEVFPLAS